MRLLHWPQANPHRAATSKQAARRTAKGRSSPFRGKGAKVRNRRNLALHHGIREGRQSIPAAVIPRQADPGGACRSPRRRAHPFAVLERPALHVVDQRARPACGGRSGGPRGPQSRRCTAHNRGQGGDIGEAAVGANLIRQGASDARRARFFADCRRGSRRRLDRTPTRVSHEAAALIEKVGIDIVRKGIRQHTFARGGVDVPAGKVCTDVIAPHAGCDRGETVGYLARN